MQTREHPAQRIKTKIINYDPDLLPIPTDNQQYVNYQIKSLIVHDGMTTLSGHYTAWVRNSNNWIKISDSQIWNFQKLIVLDKAYLIFLEKLI